MPIYRTEIEATELVCPEALGKVKTGTVGASFAPFIFP